MQKQQSNSNDGLNNEYPFAKSIRDQQSYHIKMLSYHRDSMSCQLINCQL